MHRGMYTLLKSISVFQPVHCSADADSKYVVKKSEQKYAGRDIEGFIL